MKEKTAEVKREIICPVVMATAPAVVVGLAVVVVGTWLLHLKQIKFILHDQRNCKLEMKGGLG